MIVFEEFLKFTSIAAGTENYHLDTDYVPLLSKIIYNVALHVLIIL